MKRKIKESLKKQVGGSHYKNMNIQPMEYIVGNNLLFPEGAVVKYVSRHRFKNGKEDIEKAIQNLEIILERDYSWQRGIMDYIRYKNGETNFTIVEKFDSVEKAADPKNDGELVEVKINNLKIDFTTVKKEKDEKQLQEASLPSTETKGWCDTRPWEVRSMYKELSCI